MYKTFYGLKRNPFELSPDPYFFHPTRRHNEALATLMYGILNKKGFAVVTGEVGTGKTLLLRCLLESLNANNVACALIYNPLLTVPEFLAALMTDLRLTLAGHTKSEILADLNRYLLLRAKRGAITALIVDEAQLLSWELLEEIRLLTNLETSHHKLLQIALVGQPELDRKLDSPELRQLKQRIGLRCRLEPLTLAEFRGYLHRRLERSGDGSVADGLFSEDAIQAIHAYSQGIPRIANNLCENSLLAGYGRQMKQITAEIIREVAEDLRLEPLPAASQSRTEDFGVNLAVTPPHNASDNQPLEPGMETL
jgi:general secretion pathway protein A